MSIYDPVQKLSTVLSQLQVSLDKPKKVSLSSIFQLHGLATEYGKFIVDRGIVTVISKNKRGSRYYQWNPEYTMSQELATDLLGQFNAKRATYNKSLDKTHASKYSDVLDRLTRIEGLLEQLIAEREMKSAA
jgi:hypothetical protein